ncbi:vitamin B12 dependent-methionine synthase activation domain-containing protein [[Collinsella] massiliensis]|uniref:Uncharacterized protein n=1 Tax=[Collinsella] massiliensis TaxID=1232426 RepID=A0A1Y3XZV0_9ACTN|nr:vitamin B12 dependent-methionine synthase activation domain-containing protein [[Collinsella] massiliensis]OUN89838.1 hypothetical protein B5G02_00345 [[Collinsella] massiliensis]
MSERPADPGALQADAPAHTDGTGALPLGTPCPWSPPAAALRVPRAEMLRYLGHTGQKIEDGLAARIEAAAADAERVSAPRGVRAAFAVDASGADAAGNPCIRLTGTTVELTGRDIYRHLKDAEAAVVLAVTLGMESERRLRLLGTLQPLDAALFDAACSALVEEAAEALDRAAKQEAARFGLTGNWRFSCGYGDLPLEAQGSLLDALDARRALGITLTPSNLMIPAKSVTAVFGLFRADALGGGSVPAADAVRSCRGCARAGGCAFRSRGTRCYR